MNFDDLKLKINNSDTVEILKVVSKEFPQKVLFTSSFGLEDQVITDMIFRNDIGIKVVSIDTGRLFEETHKVFDETVKKYKKTIEIYCPDTSLLQEFLSKNGSNSFYDAVENRKMCCNIRKVEPLQRALTGHECWVTGIREEQSQQRQNFDLITYDSNYNLYKLNPLYYWTLEDVFRYIKENEVPYNKLCNEGFISIGCAPCTRAVKEGESFRDGRWWWEKDAQKECGLHS